jgi:hypothetical protein
VLLVTLLLIAGSDVSAGLAGRREAAVPAPTVTGPVPATVRPGDPSHNYPFGAAHVNLTEYGYREDEFFIEGRANEYTLNGVNTAAVASGPYAYKTRVIVRRPLSASRFNGTVIQEWNNVSSDDDQENDWLWSHQHLMREGYAYIGVSAQWRGIEKGLKVFNPSRYGSLDADAGGKFRDRARVLSFDIFSQAAQAAKHPQGVALLGNLKVRNIIATGHSHNHLYPYYNGIHPAAGVIDGFVFHGGGTGQDLRRDLKTPAFRLFSEREVIRAATRDLPDGDYLRTWEVAGAAHADWDLVENLNAVMHRDLPQSSDSETSGMCEKPPLSRIPSRMVQYAVYDAMKTWIEKGKQPPVAPRIQLAAAGTGRGGAPGEIARDDNGNALGGIRLAQLAVPTATDTGENSGGQYCDILGSHIPFDSAKLDRMYPTHAGYVAAVERITEANLKAGYITKDGAEETIRLAKQAKVGAKAK